MKKTILAGLVAALAAGLVGCTPQTPRDAETVNLQRIQIDGEEWQKIQFTEHVYTKEEVDRIVDDLESKTITVESDPTVPDWAKAPNPPGPAGAETDPVWNAEKGNYVKTNHIGNVRIRGSFSQGSESDYEDYPTEDTTAVGDYSHAEGMGTTALGRWSHSEGRACVATGECSHAEGAETVAYGESSHAEGLNTRAGSTAHAEGCYTRADGPFSHAEGSGTVAVGGYSHAEGAGTIASGWYSHTEGASTTTSNRFAHAEGDSTIAFGEGSHAEGERSQANADFSHVSGHRAVADNNHNYAFVWQGNKSANVITYYHSHGKGTFNINPQPAEGSTDPATGVYIGEETLKELIERIVDARLNQGQ